jgi:hypothetical protein
MQSGAAGTILGALFAAVGAPACSSSPKCDFTRVILPIVIVTDGTSGQRICDATVSIRVTTDGGIIPPDAVLLLPFSRGGDASGCEYVGTQINASTDAPGSYVLTVSKDGYAQASVSGSIATFCSCLAQSCPAAPQRSVVLAPVSTQGRDASLDSGSVD